MNSNDWVAEHVMGYGREICQGTMGGGNTSSDRTRDEIWFYCGWCGHRLNYWKATPCPNYPFPKFTLVDLMRKLGEKGDHVMVRYDARRPKHNFTVILRGNRVADTDDPLQSLCDCLYQHRLYPHAMRHCLRQPEGKHFVSGEQVLEEYIAGHWRPGLELAHLTATFDMLAFRVKRLEKRFEALLEELPPEVINFRTI